MSRESPGLRPIGPDLDAVVIDLARRNGRLAQYRQLLETENRRRGERAAAQTCRASGLRVIYEGRE